MNNSAPTPNTPPRRSRGRGRGGLTFSSRGARGQSRGDGAQPKPPPKAPPPSEEKPEDKKLADGKKEEVPDDDSEKEVCFICASDIVHLAVAPCNHRTCHICSLRWRALYKTKTCAHCRTPGEFVIFTDEATKHYNDFTPADIKTLDSQNGIKFTDADIAEESKMILELNCPEETCDRKFSLPHDLRKHVSIHKKRLCDLCLEHKRVFIHEQVLYTPDELRRHLDKGDDKPGAVDQSGFKGHPRCEFCRNHFYSNDELLAHCREQHERCFLCDDGRPQYFLNYDALADHFSKDHYMCYDRECMEQKFVVFKTQIDLRAHQIEKHPNGITKNMRQVDLSDFDLRERYVPENRGGRRGDRRGGREGPRGGGGIQTGDREQAEDTANTAAAVRQRTAVANVTDFPTLPSSNSAAARPARQQPARPTSSAQPPAQRRVQPAAPTAQAASTPLSRENLIKQARHAAVVDRASVLVNNNTSKIATFTDSISSYNRNLISASELVEALTSIFESASGSVPISDAGTLMKELSDLFDNANKKTALLKAWNDWKAINEGSAGDAGVHGGAKVLKLKSMTAKSEQASLSRTASWGTVASNTFLSGPAVTASSSRRGTPLTSGTTPWANAVRPTFAGVKTSSFQTTTASSSTAAAGRLGRQAAPGSGALADNSAFPALPSRPKSRTTGLAAGSGVLRITANGTGGGGVGAPGTYFKTTLNSGGKSIAPNAWSGGAPEAGGDWEEDVPSADASGANDAAAGSGTGKKKKGKQVLMHFG